MASRGEALIIGLLNAFAATGIGYGVALQGVDPAWLFFAALNAFVAVANAARLGVLLVQQEGEHRG